MDKYDRLAEFLRNRGYEISDEEVEKARQRNTKKE